MMMKLHQKQNHLAGGVSQVDCDAYIAGIVYCLPGNDNNGVQVHAKAHVAPLSESW